MNSGFKRLAFMATLFFLCPYSFGIHLYSSYDGNNLNDSVSGNIGTAHGAANIFGPGRCGSSFRFDGVDDYISTQIEVIGTDDFSVSTWIQTKDDKAPIFDAINGTGFSLGLAAGKLRVILRGNGSFMPSIYTTNEDIADGGWHHVMVSVDRDQSGGVKIYVDGILLKSGSALAQTGTINNTGASIGRAHVWGTFNRPHFEGLIDGIKLFKGVETPESIMPLEDCPLDPNGNVTDWFNGQNFLNVAREGIAQTINGADVFYDVFIGDGQCTDGYHFNGNDGQGDYLIAPWVLPNNGEGDFTLSLWIRVDENDVGGNNLLHRKLQYLLDKNDAFSLYVNEEGKVVFRMYAPEPGNYDFNDITSSIKVTSNFQRGLEWYHVMVSVDRDEPNEGIKLYIDGILSATGDPTSLQGDVGAGDMTIGTAYNYRLIRAASAMDEIKIYTTALTPSEVNRTEPCKSDNLSNLDCGQLNDLLILQDASSSFSTHIDNINGQITGVIRRLHLFDENAKIGISTFRDRYNPFFVNNNSNHPGVGLFSGNTGDYIYQNHVSLTSSIDSLQNALNNIAVGGGGDSDESVLEALFYSAKWANEIGYRNNSKRTIIIATESSFHEPGRCLNSSVCTRENDGDENVSPEEGIPPYEILADALINMDITPVFAVHNSALVQTSYETLLETLSGHGVNTGKVLVLDRGGRNFYELVFNAMGCTVQ